MSFALNYSKSVVESAFQELDGIKKRIMNSPTGLEEEETEELFQPETLASDESVNGTISDDPELD